MPNRLKGASSGDGGGGGGLTLGPPTNSFNAATKALAEAARDTYANANAAWLAQYDAEPTFTIEISWPVAATDTVYQSRRGGAWADVTGLIRGQKGAKGADGAQARFLVYAYVNSAVAPTAAPTGGTFVQSTGTLTVPVGYTAIPVTPVLTERTYRTQAVVNPANDTDIVTLVWGLPAESPEYDAASQAEDSADRAAASALEAQAGAAQVTSYSGAVPIIENEPFESNNLDFTVGGWRDYDFIQAVVRDSNATVQIDRPSSLIPTASLDANGESRSPFNNNDEFRIKRIDGSDVLTVNITGWALHPAINDVLTIYGIRSGVEAGAGGGGGVGPTGPAGMLTVKMVKMEWMEPQEQPTGPTGPTGSAGADGNDGDTGPIGPAGMDGADGDTGPIGPIGPQSAQSAQQW